VVDGHTYGACRSFVGQVERDRDGVLWAALYSAPEERRGFLLSREVVRSLRQGKRRVSDLVLAEADASSELAGPSRRH
jgi:hypothetical protein